MVDRRLHSPLSDWESYQEAHLVLGQNGSTPYCTNSRGANRNKPPTTCTGKHASVENAFVAAAQLTNRFCCQLWIAMNIDDKQTKSSNLQPLRE
jgi:hypothetical protein